VHELKFSRLGTVCYVSTDSTCILMWVREVYFADLLVGDGVKRRARHVILCCNRAGKGIREKTMEVNCS
jgi:hypothetical protein